MIKGKKILIIGIGKEGISAAKFLGNSSKISIVDEKGKSNIYKDFLDDLKNIRVNCYFENKLPKNLNVDLIIRSPGVRPDHFIIRKLHRKGTKITTATNIFFEECPCIMIGITGTKGKGTTSTLIFEMLQTQNKDVHLAGNIGIPMLDILPRLKKKSLVVLELSSFQLMDLSKSPHVAVILMITQEHLDWHKDLKEYHEAKRSIVEFQNSHDFAVINQDFPISKNFAENTKSKIIFVSTKRKTNGIFVEKEWIISNFKGKEKIISAEEILLPGKHNLQNVLAATAVAKIFNVDNKNIVEVLRTFKGLIHRLQLVRELKGIRYYNDSFATTPETTIAAIEAFSNPKILILGGSSKNSDFSTLGNKIAKDKTIKAIILIGFESGRIKEAIDLAGGFEGKIVAGLKNMKSIINKAYNVAENGDIVLLSPACASFDMFKNYQDRGEQFIKCVKELK